MKHTREQLDGMSDFERNELIVKLAYDTLNTEKDRFISLHSVHQDGNRNAAVYFANHKSGEVVAVGRFDFNSWNDIMPLAVEYGICADAKRKMAWIEEPYGREVLFKYVTESTTPQRAIACCLIMVLENKKGA
jgi:hypothetical protein